jgi:rubrerythrin
MKVFNFAMKMEKDGKAYYEKLAEQCQIAGLSEIFSRLAADEQKHYETFRGLKAGSSAAAMADTDVIEETQKIFTDLPRGNKTLESLKEALDAYRYAMKIEADSFRFYEDAAAKETDSAIQKLLLKIAEEEHKHFTVLENIYHFINAPNQYLAWAEFSNLDEFRQFGRDVDT